MEQATVAQLVSGGGTLVFAYVVWMELRGFRQELREVLSRLLAERADRRD